MRCGVRRPGGKGWAASCASAAVALAVPNGAHAQAIDSAAIPVTERGRPGYTPIGVRVGGFHAYPRLATNLVYDDDILANTSIRAEDGTIVLAPQLVVKSDWSRNSLRVTGNAAIRRYFSRTIENSEQYGIGLDGQYDIARNTNVVVNGVLARRIEPRGTEGDTFVGGAPISYRAGIISAQGTTQFGRFTLTGGGGYSNFKYNDVVLGGVAVDLRFRNYESITGDSRLAYRVTPGLALVLSGSVNQGTYANSTIVGGRNSHGYAVLGGVAFGISPLLTGEFGLGYIRQDFDNPIFPAVNGLNYRASILWNPTNLTTVTGKLDKSIQRAPLVGVAGIEQTNAALQIDHELLRNLIVNGTVTYSLSSYRGLNRSSDRIGGTVSARYLISKNISFTTSAAHTRQNAANATVVGGSGGRSYDRNQLLFGVVLQQ